MTAAPEAPSISDADTLEALAEDLDIACEHPCHEHAGSGAATVMAHQGCPCCGRDYGWHSWCAVCLAHMRTTPVQCPACGHRAAGRAFLLDVTPIRAAS